MRLGAAQLLRQSRPARLAQRDPTARIHLEIAGPVGVLHPRNEQAAIGLLHETEGDLDGAARRPTEGLEPGDLPPAGELLAQAVRQRPRTCQDLPSVATAGA